MNILFVGNFLNPSWDGSQPDEEHIAGALEELGHDVTRYQREDVDTGLMLHPDVRSEWADFVLVAQWDGYPEWTIKQMKDIYKCPVIYWAFDYQTDGQEWHERLVREADLYLSKRIADSKYPNWRWLSQDFSPKFLDRHPYPVEKDIDVLFTGSYLPWATERNETLKAVDEKFNLVVHSVNAWDGFKDVRPPIMDEGLPELYARAKVILSIDHTLEAGYWSDRNAQIMACGRMPIFRYVPLSEVRFRTHVRYFHSIDECLWLIEENMYDTKAVFGDSMSHEYAQANLKVKNRVQDLLTIVGNIL